MAPRTRRANPLDDLRRYLKSVKELWAWAAGAAVVPFLVNFANLAPPWPPAIAYLTAVFELVALLWAYHSMQSISRVEATVRLRRYMVFFFGVTILYLFVHSLFTIGVPRSDLVLVKGFMCTEVAASQFANCPWLIAEDIQQAEWDAALLWTPLSIAVTRIGIVLLWLLAFFSLSLFLGAFLVRLRLRA